MGSRRFTVAVLGIRPIYGDCSIGVRALSLVSIPIAYPAFMRTEIVSSGWSNNPINNLQQGIIYH